jgi:hypothetical protein
MNTMHVCCAIINNLVGYPNLGAYSMPTADVLALQNLMERPW